MKDETLINKIMGKLSIEKILSVKNLTKREREVLDVLFTSGKIYEIKPGVFKSLNDYEVK